MALDIFKTERNQYRERLMRIQNGPENSSIQCIPSSSVEGPFDVEICSLNGDMCMWLNGVLVPTTSIKIEQTEPSDFAKITCTFLPTALKFESRPAVLPKIDWM